MPRLLARRHFAEMEELENLIKELGSLARYQHLGNVSFKGWTYPLHVLSVGSQRPEDPSLGFFGGVHGLEKIGSEVVLAYLKTVSHLMRWDKAFQNRLERSRLVFMPIVNPIGIVLHRRANGNNIDLMRNSPIDGEEPGGPIYRGHRISSLLPWYRGEEGAEMEKEARAMCRVVEEYLLCSKVSFAVDVHSGFGSQDRFWFPYAHTKTPFPLIAETFALKTIFDATYSHHFYAIEPVSRQYTIHGDMWDYIFLEHLKKGTANTFIPWTLEMGSWLWLKKNPSHIFSKIGAFHPIKPHRHHRILRRHLNLFDFLHRSLLSPELWLDIDDSEREKNRQKALGVWYGP